MNQLSLSNNERERIRHEEIYRQEIRKSLESSKPKKGRILEILNGPFVLWVLSAVLLSGITSIYAKYNSRIEASKIQLVRVQRIIVDLNTRIERAKVNLKEYSERRASWTTIEMARGAFPEFEERDFYSVAVELQILRPNDAILEELITVWREIMTEPGIEKSKEILTKASEILKQEARLISR